MIPDRSLSVKGGCLTRYAYQEMPMVPRAPSNAGQRKVVEEVEELPEPGRLRKPPRPRKPKVKVDGRALYRQMNLQRMEQEVAAAFAGGPLTSEAFREKVGLQSRSSANVKLNEWLRRGLVKHIGDVTTEAGPKVGQHSRVAKLWDKV